MDQKSTQALEPYLLLSKSVTSPQATCSLITKATSDPLTFSFSRLLRAANIKRLSKASEEHARYLRLLELFAFGNLQDYNSNQQSLPKLTPQQEKKLRQLSLVGYAKTSSALAYGKLQTLLALDSDQAIEQIMIESIDANLLTARLSPADRVVEVSSLAPVRDVHPREVQDVVKGLDSWVTRAEETISGIEARISEIRRRALDDESRTQRTNEIIEARRAGEHARTGKDSQVTTSMSASAELPSGLDAQNHELRGQSESGVLEEAMDVDHFVVKDDEL